MVDFTTVVSISQGKTLTAVYSDIFPHFNVFIITAVVELHVYYCRFEHHVLKKTLTLLSLSLPRPPSRALQRIVSSTVSPVLSKDWIPRITSRLGHTHAANTTRHGSLGYHQAFLTKFFSNAFIVLRCFDNPLLAHFVFYLLVMHCTFSKFLLICINLFLLSTKFILHITLNILGMKAIPFSQSN